MELDKYLKKHKLNLKGRKSDKVNAITANVLRTNQANVVETALEKVVPSEGESSDSSDEDLVIEEIGTASSGNELDDNKMSTDNPLPLVVKTRYGRYAGYWNLYQIIEEYISYYCTLLYLDSLSLYI